jgi:prephenate dehydrogenase
MTVQLTIIGLGKIGASVGLALCDDGEQLTRVGHDINFQTAQEAKKIAAVDTIERNLFNAIKHTDILLLAIPVDQVVETLELIKDDLRPDTVILDMASVKQATLEWVEKNLPDKLHYLSMLPTLNAKTFTNDKTGIAAADGEMFKNSHMVIASPKNTESDALTVASNLAIMLGAAPYYADVVESDGLVSGTHVLPQLIASALMNCIGSQPGWVESRKIAGNNFYHTTAPILNLDDQVRLGESMMLNQENVVRQLDMFIQELVVYRDVLQEKDFETLSDSLSKAKDERLLWLSRRLDNDWNTTKSHVDLPSAKEMFGRMFGFGNRDKNRKK